MPGHDADSEHPRPSARRRRRAAWAVGIVAGAVVGAAVVVPSFGSDLNLGDRSGSLNDRYEKAVAEVSASEQEADGTTTDDGHAHDHSDQSTKNDISRSGEGTADTADPTTLAERMDGIQAVAAQRAEADPELVPLAKRPGRADVPEDRYAMAGGCYTVQDAASGKFVRRSADGFAVSAGKQAQGEPFHFQATDLGKYLLFGSQEDFVARAGGTPLDGLGLTGGGDAVAAAAEPGESADWVVRGGSTYTFTLEDGSEPRHLAVGDGGALTLADSPARFRLRLTEGCAAWPEVSTSTKGRTFRGVSGIQEVRGYTDAHTHGMAFEFLGGEAHCGRPWNPYGVELALQDCEDHQQQNGCASPLETALSQEPCHDPVGWPTFKDWPAPASLTHEGTYWKWMERSWQGGLRLFVNLLVENNQLCQLYPYKRNSCDDMDSIRLQAKQMRAFERYVDAQWGGPGEGWYRIVTNPFQARRVVNAGKLAVVMGIETSIPFKCTIKFDTPQCDEKSIDASLAEVHKMGVRQMELVNKFDNALSGVAGDSGQTGVLVNGANFLETGSFWAMEHCEPETEGEHDKEQYAAPEIDRQQQDALFGAIYQAFGPQRVAPVYDSGPHCNQRGLTDLGKHLIKRMAERGMVFDPDHMSVSGRQSALDLLEELQYPGVISSHSWSTPDAYPRIYRLGGTVVAYAGDSTGFVEKWRRHMTWADPRYYWGFGFGADINGLGAQGGPRGADVPNPVSYPFEALGGVTVDKQRSGERVYDINADGVSHYGLYPDWIEDLTKVAAAKRAEDGPAIFADMARGTEAYLQMWERAVGVKNDACRDPRTLGPVSAIRDLPQGTSAARVVKKIGQPNSRLDDTFTYCAQARSGRTVEVTVEFTDAGRLARVR